jgi:hypothetical protein
MIHPDSGGAGTARGCRLWRGFIWGDHLALWHLGSDADAGDGEDSQAVLEGPSGHLRGDRAHALRRVPLQVTERGTGRDAADPQTRSFGSMYLASQYMAARLAGDEELDSSLESLPEILPDLLYRWEGEVRALAEEG